VSAALQRALELSSGTTNFFSGKLCHRHQQQQKNSSAVVVDNDEVTNNYDSSLQLETARAWIAMRDAIETGKAKYRFSENQLLYHYTKDTKYLVRAAMDGRDC
jgi:hypothetical protein